MHYGVQAAEEKSNFFKRSIYIAKDIKKGEAITKEHLKVIRPGLGLSTKHIDMVMGRKVKRDIPAGTPLTFDLI